MCKNVYNTIYNCVKWYIFCNKPQIYVYIYVYRHMNTHIEKDQKIYIRLLMIYLWWVRFGKQGI